MEKITRFELGYQKDVQSKEDIVLIPYCENKLTNEEQDTGKRVRFVDMIEKRDRAIETLERLNAEIALAEKVIGEQL
jgi:hypothetical protein